MLASSSAFTIGYYALSARNGPLGQEEESLANLRQATRLLHRSSIPDLNPQYAINARFSADGHLAELTGDYLAAIPVLKTGAAGSRKAIDVWPATASSIAFRAVRLS